MQPIVLGKDSQGLPLTNVVADLSDRMARVDFTHAALWGPLDARIEWGGTLDEGFDFADRYLGNPIEIWSPDGDWCWEGLIWTVSFGAGQRRRTRSLEGYAEWGKVFYTKLSPYSGAPITDYPAFVLAGTRSDVRPGFLLNLGELTEESATAKAQIELSQRSRLLWLPEPSGLLPPSEGSAPTIMLECLGWYRTFWYTQHPRYTNEFWSIGTIIRQILDESCPYVSTDLSQVETGNFAAMRNYFDKQETPGEIIKRLVPLAGGGEEIIGATDYVFGLDRGRVPYLRHSKRFSTTVDYVERIDGAITTVGGAEVAPWMIRPDTILKQQDFVPSSASLETAIDGVESIYLSQVSYSSADNSVSYQGAVAGVLGQVGAQ